MMKILIADHFPIVRKGLQQVIIEGLPGATVCEAGDTDSLYRLVTTYDWDVVLCDTDLCGNNGIEILHQIQMIKKDQPVLMMSMDSQDQLAARILKAGASGYIKKEMVHEEIVTALQRVMAGKRYISESVAEKLANQLKHKVMKLPHEQLSNREFEVFLMLASGHSNAAIAERLFLSAATVSTYRSRLMDKMGRRSNSELVRYALEKKLI